MPPKSQTPAKALSRFRSECRKVLWVQNGPNDKGKLYQHWEDRQVELEKAGLSRQQAIVAASKEYPCLANVFRRIDVSFYDPDPSVAPAGTGGDKEASVYEPLTELAGPEEEKAKCARFTSEGVPERDNPEIPKNPTGVVCEDIEQTYLENLRWAAETAGVFFRTNRSPKTCPNNQAWFLYRMAIEDHKAFLDKLHTMEVKAKDEAEKEAQKRLTSKRGIQEIELMLQDIKAEMTGE